MKLATLTTSVAAALGSALLSSAAQAAVVTIDFDGAVNTNITHAYAGLTFDSPVGTQVPVRTWSAPSTDTGNNILGLSGQNNFYAFNQSTSAIDIYFDTAVSSVSIAAAFLVATDQFLGIGGLPFMAVYNSTSISAASRLGADTWNIAGDSCLTGNFCSSGWDTLSFNSSSADIRAIRLSGFVTANGAVSRLAMFDTLRYDTGTGGGDGDGGGTVPEPGSAVLASLALLGLWATRRRTPAQYR
jgi:hypothetical protein